MKITNIKWDIDIDDIYEQLDEMSVSDAAKALEISTERYANMSTSERHDYAYNVFYHYSMKYDFLGLPEEIDITESELNERSDDTEAISDWLSNTYGYCHNGFDLVCTVTVGFKNSKDKEKETRFELCIDGDRNNTMIKVMNLVLDQQKTFDIEEVTYIYYV